MASSPDMHKGLDGVVVDTTAVSMVNQATNSLTYRGYPVQQLCASCSFEEVAYLIWHGELPTATELEKFVATERQLRDIPDELRKIILATPKTCHPMDVLRTAVSFLGACDPREDDASPQANLAKSIDMMAKLPTVVAFDKRRRHDEAPVAPDKNLSFAENFFKMTFDELPDNETVRAFEVSLILYAEHSFNASTFTARVITSSLSDIYSAVTGAIGSLKGPLHGGANEAVMHVFDEIGEPDNTETWLKDALANKKLIMGFGHRVYKNGDSRVPTMRASLDKIAASHGAADLMEIYNRLEVAMLEAKGLQPNLDYPTGPAYYLMGFDIPTFTPIFVMSRITGWTAHIIEQLSANALIRPLSLYVGPEERNVADVADRLTR